MRITAKMMEQFGCVVDHKGAEYVVPEGSGTIHRHIILNRMFQQPATSMRQQHLQAEQLSLREYILTQCRVTLSS